MNEHLRHRMAGILLSLAGFIMSVLCILPGSACAESTAHIDLRMAFEKQGSEFYSEHQDLALDILETRIPLVQAAAGSESTDVGTWIHDFIQRGFRKEESDKFLFDERNKHLREGFLGSIQKSNYRLSQDFLKNVYAAYQSSPDSYEYSNFLKPAWIDFSSGLADENTYQRLTELLDSIVGRSDMKNYLPVLYYAYKSHARHEADFDNHIQRRLLNASSFSPENIKDLYTNLNQDYWNQFQAKKAWMLEKASWHLYSDFSAHEWANLPADMVVDLAGVLARTSQTPEHKRIEPVDWLMKIGTEIKKTPSDQAVYSLLSYFIGHSTLSLRESFQALQSLFAADQTMFVRLHMSPPDSSPMSIWHGNKDNLEDCIKLLEGFFQIDKAGQWDAGLWDCLRDNYYKKSDSDIRRRVFERIIKPIYEKDELDSNPVRKKLLSEVYQQESFLTDDHRYEVAHYFLSHRQMTDTFQTQDDSISVLKFAVDVYNNLKPDDAQLFESNTLKALIRGNNAHGTEQERIVAYINHVIEEPLTLLCYAFIGKTEQTRGITFSLQSDTAQVELLEELLRRIVQLKAELQQNYGYNLGRIPVLEAIMKDVEHEMGTAIQNKDIKKLIDMIRLALKITVVLDDDSYLDDILTALRKDVFGIGDDPSLFVQLSPDDLEQKVQYFSLLHSKDLTDALRAVGEPVYFRKFYDMLYVPLRSIYGFFNKAGAKPYLEFVAEFSAHHKNDSDENALESFVKEEINSLGSIHDEKGQPKYINAEEAIADFITALVFEKTNVNPWEKNGFISINKNVNLGVFYRILNSRKEQEYWRLSQQDNNAACYRSIADTFLGNLNDPDRMDKTVPLYDEPQHYSRWDFFVFIQSLVNLYEIYGYPFPGIQPSSLYEGDPERGIKHKPLAGDSVNAVSARKVDGSLRADVIDAFMVSPQDESKESAAENNLTAMAELAVLLPNNEINNAGADSGLQRYFAQKEKVAAGLTRLLEGATVSSKKLTWLIWLCRLETSVGGLLDENKGFEYAQIRSKYLSSLDRADQLTLRLEEYCLKEMNKVGGSQANTALEIAPDVRQLVETLAKDYAIMREVSKGELDATSRALLDFYKKTTPKNILEELKPEHLGPLWFITTQCRTALADSAQRLEKIDDKEKLATADIISSLFVVYSYFLPYVDSGFSVRNMFEATNALPVFCMLNYEIKKPVAELLPLYRKMWPAFKNTAQMPLSPLELETFLICHNFLPVSLLDACLENPDRFLALAAGTEVKVRAYNFRILWEREDKASVSLEHLCSEVLGGMECNREIISAGGELKDDAYLEYFFGDMRKIIDKKHGDWKQAFQNLDSAVYSLAFLPEDRRLDSVKAALEKRIAEIELSAGTTDHENLKSRLKSSLEDINGFKTRIQATLGRGYDYFGQVLANRFSSFFAVQKACEDAVEHMDASLSKDAVLGGTRRYKAFYESGLFDGSHFIRALEQQMSNLFYAGLNSDKPGDFRLQKQADFCKFLDGGQFVYGESGFVTKGLVGQAAVKSEPGVKYIGSGTHLLRALFCGAYRDSGQPFIGDLIWGKNDHGELAVKPLPYDEEGREKDIRSLAEWVFDCGKKYTGIPEVKDIFMGKAVAPAESVQKKTPE